MNDLPASDVDGCPVCGGCFAFLYTIDRFRPPLKIVRCQDCGLQRQARLPDKDALPALYNQGYYEGTAAYTYQDERKKERFHDIVWRARLRTISRFVPPPANFLDVGCSFGGLVASAGRFGYRARGIDLSDFAVSEGRKMDRDLYPGTIDSKLFEPGTIDVITLIEVIEHLPDPVSAIRAAHELLGEGGLLVIQTANFLGLQASSAGASYHYYLPGHLYYYSTKNLRMLLEKEGFDLIRFYRGTDFGLLPKLKKMRGDFRSFSDFFRWIPVSLYHFKSRIALGDFALTSSMVCYARKKK